MLYGNRQKHRTMLSRSEQNAIVDICALISFLPSLISGLVLFLVLPSGGGGSGGGKGVLDAVEFLGLTRAVWKDLHNYSSLIFAALIIIHLVLHWRYFRTLSNRFTDKKEQKCDAD
jgi:hypothetical protein